MLCRVKPPATASRPKSAESFRTVLLERCAPSVLTGLVDGRR
jgi:hypothetical protein